MKANRKDLICVLTLSYHNVGAGGVAGCSTFNGHCNKDIKMKRTIQRENRARRAMGYRDE